MTAFDDPNAESTRAAELLRGRAYVRFGLDNAEGYRILFMSRGDLKPKEEFMDEGSGRTPEAGRSEPEPCRPVDRMCQSVPYGRHVRR